MESVVQVGQASRTRSSMADVRRDAVLAVEDEPSVFATLTSKVREVSQQA